MINRHESGRWRWWFGGILVTGFLMAAIRSESFWIDELSSAFLAAQSSWGGMVSRLADLGSEAQMPLHVVWLWLWSRAFGVSEWALRASNIPWALLAIVAWVGLVRKSRCSIWSLGLLLSPFICYYMNEARPYILTFASSVLSLYAVESLCAEGEGNGPMRTRGALVAGVGLCAGASMLNLIVVPSLAIYLAVRLPGSLVSGVRAWIRNNARTMIALAVLLSCFTGYYVLTLMQGHGGQREPFTWINAAYAIYEMLGFGGLGAPRILMRELTVSTILSRYGVTLSLGLAVWSWVVWVIWARRRDVWSDPAVRAALAGLLVGVLSLAMAAVCGKVSLWGRHFMVMMPLLLWGGVRALEKVCQGQNSVVPSVLLGLIALFLFSSIRQRVMDEYRKDPLREAMTELSTLVRQSPDVPAVVVTAPLALWCYGSGVLPALTPVIDWPEARARRWQGEHSSYFMLMHRPDKCDPQGVWTKVLGGTNARLLWQDGNIKIYRVSKTGIQKGER